GPRPPQPGAGAARRRGRPRGRARPQAAAAPRRRGVRRVRLLPRGGRRRRARPPPGAARGQRLPQRREPLARRPRPPRRRGAAGGAGAPEGGEALARRAVPRARGGHGARGRSRGPGPAGRRRGHARHGRLTGLGHAEPRGPGRLPAPRPARARRARAPRRARGREGPRRRGGRRRPARLPRPRVRRRGRRVVGGRPGPDAGRGRDAVGGRVPRRATGDGPAAERRRGPPAAQRQGRRRRRRRRRRRGERGLRLGGRLALAPRAGGQGGGSSRRRAADARRRGPSYLVRRHGAGVTTQQTQAPRAPSTLSQMDPANTRLHFVGVGGVSMQALAMWCREDGFAVSGCDPRLDGVRGALVSAGIEVHDAHDVSHAHDAEVVVHSMAVPADHPELVAARQAGALVVRRIELLGELFRRRRSIGVTGSHGKSTTTGMLATMLTALDPGTSVQLGAKLPSVGGSHRYGAGGWLVAEVDESDAGFADLAPEVAVVTNLEDDHIAGDFLERRNYHASVADLEAAARRYALGARALVYCADWPDLGRVVAGHPYAVTFGVSDGADFRVTELDVSETGSAFTLARRSGAPLRVRLGVPGRHNALNAAAAIAALTLAGFDAEAALPALEAFR